MLFIISLFFFNSVFAFDHYDFPEVDKKDKEQIIKDVFAETATDLSKIKIVALDGVDKLFVLLKNAGNYNIKSDEAVTDRVAELFLISKNEKYEILFSKNFKYDELCFAADPYNNRRYSDVSTYSLVLDNNVYKINSSNRAFAVYCEIIHDTYSREPVQVKETYFNAIRFNSNNLETLINLLVASEGDNSNQRHLKLSVSENKWTFYGVGNPPMSLKINIMYK